MSEKGIKRKPDWLKVDRTPVDAYANLHLALSRKNLHTICESGMCPNKAECWTQGTATFMILGDICTRNCKFCAVNTGKPLSPDVDEPYKILEVVKLLNLKHVVLTSVTRDDLPDQGAEHWAKCIKLLKDANFTVEALVPDFDGDATLIKELAMAKPDIFSHNLETVRSLTSHVRTRATYETSLKTLDIANSFGMLTKSGIMVGLGEKFDEVIEVMDDLLKVNCKIITIGQYLQPSKNNFPVAEYIKPEIFDEYKNIALKKGFDYVESAPLVRSSYHSEKILIKKY
ncbi:MAG: lipoyl synthase [Bacteroidales bacterium]|jgi:lipoic acid synthetase|nr:lipoyl synthase [Bacteroidales bacterium]MDD3755716.1 lipoyl synthase [Bacteroidales bacterium]MDI9575168.1 lipoyl synthase [Bacteroidota bacterium]MDY0400833.1 lipoyl synthase [Bacteroidales bacterium]